MWSLIERLANTSVLTGFAGAQAPIAACLPIMRPQQL